MRLGIRFILRRRLYRNREMRKGSKGEIVAVIITQLMRLEWV
jgi:hypothetical protein